jgi:uncharacterized repeat protein (TIGR03803 family)
VFYGTTDRGGAYFGRGTLYSVTPSGTESVLHSFNNYTGDGSFPVASVINVLRAGHATVYGTTENGGGGCGSVGGCGTVFAVSSGTESVLHQFNGYGDGTHPYGALLSYHGKLYGTTSTGGAYNLGTVFAISLSSGGESVLHSFGDGSGDGASPQYVRLVELNGILFGTTEYGGANGLGTVFSITPSGAESVLYSFSGYPGDGSHPYAGLINVNGTLYGTTYNGGVGNANSGTVFSLTPSGSETILYAFSNDATSGGAPTDSLIFVHGTLYGTTSQGGASGYGTVFSLIP